MVRDPAAAGGVVTKRTQAPMTVLELFVAVKIGMGWDDEKTARWFNTENPNLGGITPTGLWVRRPEKLEAWIVARLDENRRPGDE